MRVAGGVGEDEPRGSEVPASGQKPASVMLIFSRVEMSLGRSLYDKLVDKLAEIPMWWEHCMSDCRCQATTRLGGEQDWNKAINEDQLNHKGKRLLAGTGPALSDRSSQRISARLPSLRKTIKTVPVQQTSVLYGKLQVSSFCLLSVWIWSCLDRLLLYVRTRRRDRTVRKME